MKSIRSFVPTRSTAILAVLVAACGDNEKTWSIEKADDSTRRTVAQGEVVGGAGRYSSHAWLGIPFAAPPTGELRWRAPHEPAAWMGTRSALTFAPGCPQFASPIGGDAKTPANTPTGSEDCLYVNVWAPKFERSDVPVAKKRLPVMFWIHGGGNSIGTASFYEGGHLAASQNVIVVSTQYRLGPFGWFRLPGLAADETDANAQSGNFGTLDIIQSLKWVRQNIAAFGGDPDNITIFGESAGGMNVYSLLVSPQAKGLFAHAIVESGGLAQTTPATAEHFVDDAEPGHKNSSSEIVIRLLQSDGLAKDRTAAKLRLAAMTSAELGAYLRSKTPAQLLTPYAKNLMSGMIDMPLVIKDGVVLPSDDWAARFESADGWNQMPVLIGTNRDEAKLFLFLDDRRIWKAFGIFPHFMDEPNYQATAEYESRTWKATGADGPAAAMRRSGEADVYVYRFDWHGEPTIVLSDLSKMLGAAHSFELPFVFGHFDLGKMGKLLFDKKSEADREQLSDAMMRYWAHFATRGSPNDTQAWDLPKWTAWDEMTPEKRFMILDGPDKDAGIRMCGDVQTMPKIIADIDADARLPRQIDKCRVFHELAGWTRGMSKADYVTVGKKGCAEFPYADFPWGAVAVR